MYDLENLCFLWTDWMKLKCISLHKKQDICNNQKNIILIQHSILRSLMFMKLHSSLNAHHNLEELILNVNLTVTGYLTLNN